MLPLPMAGIDPRTDPRGARWEARLRVPVLTAGWLAIPTVFLYFSDLKGATAIVAVAMAWAIWFVFLAETVVMLSVVRDRRAWIRGHLFGLAILLATFPLLTKALEALLAARALSSLQAVRVLQVLYLAKAAKLVKGLIVVRHRGGLPTHPAVLSVGVLFLTATFAGIIDRVATGDKKATPLHATAERIASLPSWSIVLAVVLACGLLALAALRRRRAARLARA